MNTRIFQLTFIALFFLFLPGLKAQTLNDSLIFKALRDELNANMDSLRHEDYDDPFFISYTLSHIHSYNGASSMGVIESSSENVYRTSNVRLMVGDYELNDENFIDHALSVDMNSGSIPLPVDDDYYGIRQSYWYMTDEVYKVAGKLYKKKKELFDKGELPSDFVPVDDFSREEVVKMKVNREEFEINKEKLDSLIRDYSSIFNDYNDIHNSVVTLSITRTDHFFINSEGTEIHYPMDNISLSFILECKDKDFISVSDQIAYQAKSPSELPERSVVESDINSLVDSLVNLSAAPLIKEQYYGPVLFLSEASSQTLAHLLRNSSWMIAGREQLMVDYQGNIYSSAGFMNNNTSVNQKIMPDNLSLKALAHKSHYEGVELSGNFKVDSEGVVPPEEIVLVKNGILINQLNDRTPTKDIAQSNGHKRFGFGISSRAVLPGILEMEVNQARKSESELKEMLIRKAREEGLSYAYIARKMHPFINVMPLMLYRVDLETGEEKLVRVNASLEFRERAFRSISGVSSNRIVYNTLNGPAGMGRGMNFSNIFSAVGFPVSYIIPDACLVDDIIIQPVYETISVSKPIVPEPVVEKGDL